MDIMENKGQGMVTSPSKDGLPPALWHKDKQTATGAQKSLTETLTAPQYNVGKDAYPVDLENNEKVYWLVTESGLLGAFGFEGACGAGDGSCKPPTNSMGVVFCNFGVMSPSQIPNPEDDFFDEYGMSEIKVHPEHFKQWPGCGWSV